MALKYGTLESPAVQEKPASKTKTVATVAAVLAIFGFVAVSFTSGFVQVKNVVDSNYARKDVSIVSEDVMSMFNATCINEGLKIRYVLATFDTARTTIVPAVEGRATNHWERDFSSFKNALPSHEEIAFAVYNFPVWNQPEDGEQANFEILPTFVTYLAADADPSSMYLGGAYLGSAALAAACTGGNMIAVTKEMTYIDACEKLTNDRERCMAVNNQDCPFEGEDGTSEGTPCATECNGVSNFAEGEHGEECCNAIMDYCADTTRVGCSDYADAIYREHCGGVYALADTQNLLLSGYADEVDQCARECENPCNLLAEDNSDADTYKMCSGCATDGNVYAYTDGEFAANCYPGQYKFQEQRCCGVRENFATCGDYANEDSCDSMPELELGCKWSTHVECSASIGQAIEDDRLAAEAAAEAAAAAEAEAAEAEAAEAAAAEEAAVAEVVAAEDVEDAQVE
jgi:hypothetical protein